MRAHYEDTAIEAARLCREAYRAIEVRIQSQQLGELFTEESDNEPNEALQGARIMAVPL